MVPFRFNGHLHPHHHPSIAQGKTNHHRFQQSEILQENIQNLGTFPAHKTLVIAARQSSDFSAAGVRF